jgi:thioredoxin-dependent peroxiredoxin
MERAIEEEPMETGDIVENFVLPDQFGVQRSLDELLSDGPVVLFFYPAAMTKGCTAESCHFRDLAAEFEEAGATRVGISMDTVEKQRAFSDKHAFDYPLLADPDGVVARQFGVKRAISLLKTQRKTFVIGTDRRVLGTIKSETSMDRHADEALAIVRASRQTT